jgi:hypothetical protein
MQKNKFLFYTSWKKNIALMDDIELRRFITNLINYTEGNDIELITKLDNVFWNDAVELLNFNEFKRQKKIENGKKGGEAKATKSYQTVPNDIKSYQTVPNPSVEGKGIKDEGKGIKDEGKGIKDEGKTKILLKNYKQMIEEGYFTEEQIVNMKLSEVRKRLNFIFKEINNWEEELNKLGSSMFIQKYSGEYSIDYCIASDIKAMEII